MEENLAVVNSDIRKYVERTILPKYRKLPGHADDHINYVIGRSLRFAKEVPEINFDMVYIVAAYHDLGRLVNNETHNIESAKMFLEDEFIRKNFSKKEQKIMAEAIEDHRASLKKEPRNIYGKIVSSADRNTNVLQAIKRSFNYNRVLNPSQTIEETIECTRIHLEEKFGQQGYATTKMYFRDLEYEIFLKEIEKITKDPKLYRKVAKEIIEI